ncbi:MAG: TrkA family potassium uptake protein [Halobacteriales archaeon]
MPTDLDVIVAGGGRVGFQTAALLDDQGHDVTIVERDPAVCESITDAYIATVIEGDASDPETLEEAGVDGADVVAALTGQTGLNLAVCMAADRMAPGVRTVARIERAGAEAYGRFVDEVVFPERAGARAAADWILGGAVRSLGEATGDLEILRVRIEEGAPAAGRPLREVQFPAGTLVVSDDDAGGIARPETTLTPGRSYVVAVERDVVEEVLNLLRG